MKGHQEKSWWPFLRVPHSTPTCGLEWGTRVVNWATPPHLEEAGRHQPSSGDGQWNSHQQANRYLQESSTQNEPCDAAAVNTQRHAKCIPTLESW
jgi:hypothetical protein